jgi:hypothetical protein
LSYFADDIKFGIAVIAVEEKAWQKQIQRSIVYVTYGVAVTEMS